MRTKGFYGTAARFFWDTAKVVAATLVVFGLAQGTSEAGVINFIDLTDVNTITVNSPDYDITILPDSTSEFLHITYMSTAAATTTTSSSRDLTEPPGEVGEPGGVVISDRLLSTITANSRLVDLRFGSDPSAEQVSQGGTVFSSLPENGSLQELINFAPGGGPVVDRFFVQSDAVPEPSSLLLGGMAMLGLISYAWFRRKWATAIT